jgi:16S rRNA (cytosine967-C5)-methyltransferase
LAPHSYFKGNQLKIHRHLVEGITQAWVEIFAEKQFADKIIEKNFKANRKWGARDRKFFAENVYEGVRWWRRLWWLIDEDENFESDSLIRLWVVLQIQMARELPSWIDVDEEAINEIKAKIEKVKTSFAMMPIRESIPDWMHQWGKTEREEDWNQILANLNRRAPADLRVNTLRANLDQVVEAIKDMELEVEKIKVAPQGLSLPSRKNIFSTEIYKKGWVEIQDRSSQQIAPLLRVEPGHRVIDACAGAGGKSLHLAALMKNKGKILALDIHEWKLNELKTRARRGGVDIIETRAIDNAKVIKRLEKSADRLLLDVPCSGMGVLRRSPDTKWKLTMEEVERLNQVQAQILDSYSQMLKPGGLMVYATCSIMPSENQKQIEKFLQKNGEAFVCQQMINIDPGGSTSPDVSGDGFFAAVLERKP